MANAALSIEQSRPTLQASKTWHWQGHQICYTQQGDGLPLVLIHGFGASIGHWRHNISALAAAGYSVYALDLLGFGGSDKPALDYSLELWEALLIDFLEIHVKDPAILVGNSIGALLSLMIAAHAPERVIGLTLLNCAGGLNHRPEELNLPLRTVMGTSTKLVSSQTIGKFLFNQVRQKFRIRGTLQQVYGNRQAVTDELVEILYRPSCDPGAYEVFASILAAPAGPRPRDLLAHVACPMLVIWGEDDPWTPIKGSQLFQSQGNQVEFHALPKTGHCPHDERPRLVNALIQNWLHRKVEPSLSQLI